MFVETWYKVWCPKCSKPNWFCDGNTSDLTQADIELCECFACGKRFLLDEGDGEDYSSDHDELCCEKGRASPE